MGGKTFEQFKQEKTPHQFSRSEKKEKKGGAVSRFLFLNLPFIFATYPLASGGQPSSASIFGLAGPGTVPVGHRCQAS